ncbi:MAG: TolC family protein [Bacteroidetes bacterium]|nr:MAG: TolC family protein [Bacteroidota bacterium]
MHKAFRYSSIVMGCMLSLCGSSQYTPSRVTLPNAVQNVLQNRYEIQLAKINVQVANTQNHPGVAGALPTVSANLADVQSITAVNQKLNNGTVIQRSGAKANNLQANLTATQIIYNGNRIVTTKRRLAELEKLSTEQLNSLIQNTIAQVSTVYYDWVRQQNYLTTIQQALEVANKQLELVTTRKQVGLANNADVFQAQLDANALEQAKQQQILVLDNLRADFNTLMQWPPDSATTVVDTIVPVNNLAITTIVQQLNANADVKVAQANIAINEMLVKETAAQRYPTLRWNGGYNYGRNQSEAGFTLLNQNYGPNIGISVGIPIYNGGAIKQQEKAARLNTEAARVSKEVLLRDLQNAVVKNYQAYQNVLNRIAQEKKNVLISEQLLTLTQQRYELRVATILEFREAQKSFIDAKYRLVNLSFAAKAAEIELLRLGNMLSL